MLLGVPLTLLVVVLGYVGAGLAHQVRLRVPPQPLPRLRPPCSTPPNPTTAELEPVTDDGGREGAMVVLEG